jgi:hypothetical protein
MILRVDSNMARPFWMMSRLRGMGSEQDQPSSRLRTVASGAVSKCWATSIACSMSASAGGRDAKAAQRRNFSASSGHVTGCS